MEEDVPSILCVDDESNVLDGLSRILFDDFDVTTATSGAEALEIMSDQQFAVIMSDMRMPEMNGAQFLLKAKEKAPDTTRMLLTGQSDIESAMSAINDGNIFRFLMKPCPEDKLVAHINEAVRMHKLLRSEKDLLQNTLRGAIKVLTEVLSIIAPGAFSRSTYIKNYVSHMARSTGQRAVWEFEIAAMLSQVGAIILPPELLKKAFSAIAMEDDEKEMFFATPAAGAKLVESIPRLENAAKMIQYQFADEADFQEGLPEKVISGIRMLRLATAVDRHMVTESASFQNAVQAVADEFKQAEYLPYVSSLGSFKQKRTGSVLK
ncbi:response regulator, partial [bacterium]|nr:response regulator [bacterium]